ncbi:ABC transporter permease [Acetivibrio cellulolyticus]|uniref:ABC transporter permease n=1 Tax=Acetivibrio cellulolyticus TaxID=35830 RepID=UPI0001E2F066|nr:ABC-2 family transporter protein [Acetivibrio cellulolyticus]
MKRRGIAYYFHIYRKILVQDIKSKMSYRADFIISMIGMLFVNISGFLAFWVTFQNFPSINGWTYYDMLFMYGFSLLALTPVQLFFDNNWSLRHYVYSGDFIKYCFRPINLFFYYISEIFDIKGLAQLLFGGITLGYAWNKIGLDFSVLIFIKLIIALITASLFMIALNNISAATCFWILGSAYIMILVNKVKDYARYPITIYNSVFRFIFTFIIPIAFIAYYPSLAFLRQNDIPMLTYLSPVIGVIFFYISYKIWMKGATSYSGTGS